MDCTVLFMSLLAWLGCITPGMDALHILSSYRTRKKKFGAGSSTTSDSNHKGRTR